MVVRLSCSGCGGTVSADDAALRRSLAVCSQCNTIMRVPREGLEPDRDAGLHPELPHGVVVERDGERDLAVSALRPPGALAFTRLTSFTGWAAGLAGAVAFGASFGWVALFAGIPVGLAAFVAAAKLQRRHRPLELRGGLLIPSNASQKPLAVSELQQVYAAVCHVDLGGDTSFSTSNVFALTIQGERVLLMGPVENEQVALFIEHVLESELQIFDLPVMSEASQPESRAGSLNRQLAPRPATDAMPCEGCGATLAASEAETRRGMAECSHCDGLTLLHDIDAQMSALGASVPDRSYDIDEDVDGVSIVACDTNRRGGSIEVTGDRVVLRQLGIAPTTVMVSSLSQITVKETRCEEEFDLDAGLAKLRDATSLSGTIDLRGLSLGGANTISFRVTAQHESHGEIEIAAGVHDPREAFLIARTLTRVLAKSA